MAFTKALYYPQIDIKNEDWLKNAMLYWDKIQTIVPSSIKNPYSKKTAKEFYKEGFLEPYFVESNMEEINELTSIVMKYLESPEGERIFMLRQTSKDNYIYSDKLPKEIITLKRIHPLKLPYAIKSRIMKIEEGYSNKKIKVDSRFVDFYMTLLATHLAEKMGAGLLTNKEINNNLACAVKLDAKFNIPKRREYYYWDSNYQDIAPTLSQGALARLIIESVHIDSKTSVKKIIEFKEKYSNELGLFRSEIADLTNSISKFKSSKAFHQKIEDIYNNKVKPAINDLKEGLNDIKVKWTTKNFLKVTFFSTSSTILPLAYFGLAGPYALLVGPGVSLTASSILYNRDKKKILRKNPFSFVLAAEKELH